MQLERGGSRISWIGGALAVEVGGDLLLVDSPTGLADALGPALGRVRGIVFTTGRIRAVGGLVPLLCGLEPHRATEAELPLHPPLGDERVAAMAEIWERTWPDRYPIVLDVVRSGTPFDVGPVRITTFPVRVGEPRWRTGTVDHLVGVGLRLETPDLVAAVILGAAPSAALVRHCADVDLAVIEVGVVDWPRTDAPWRLRTDEALALGSGARTLWLVGDDGRPLETAES
jgi:hypothetical protein